MSMSVKQILQEVERVNAQGPFASNLKSLNHYQCPDWYLDSKFGIFIHWGLYCVPAFGNEWYPREMYRKGSPIYHHHQRTYGTQDKFGYKDFIPQFKAERFSATEWAGLFRESGAKFVVPVAEHHDGFAMYATDLNRWNAAKMGPKRDVIGELAEAIRAAGMIFGLSSHRAEHYWFFDGGLDIPSDVQDPAYVDLYGPVLRGAKDHNGRHEAPATPEFLADWLARTCELVDKYQPQLVWFDWWINQWAFQPYLKKFAAYLYNRGAEWGQGVALNYKNHALPPTAAVYDIERGQLADIYPLFWQNDTSVSKNSWGYIEGHQYKTAAAIIADLIDIVSKNGALLLNIGPKPDGTIPAPEQAILREIGAWLKVNGEAIYGTRPWTTFGEGPTTVATGAFTDTKRAAFTSADIRFTRDEETLYALPLAQPADGVIKIRHLRTGATHCPERIGRVELLGHGPVTWRHDADGLAVELPQKCASEFPCALKITA